MKDIRKESIDSIIVYFEGIGEKKFRSGQIEQWLWQHHVASFDEMLNLSKELRKELSSHFQLNKISIESQVVSKDKTIKLWDVV